MEEIRQNLGFSTSYSHGTLGTIRDGNNKLRSHLIEILCGIYQVSSLSHSFFSRALNLLSLLLQKSQYGYELKTTNSNKMSRCVYMGKIKSQQSIDEVVVNIFTKDIKMHFGIGKYKTRNISKGYCTSSVSFSTAAGDQITPLTMFGDAVALLSH
uniref:Uncharacterized protein n=1 Tax=Glossina morsitans morsitans TaxID=37546 RepID=A0A1B0G742_GLOMM